MCRAINSTTAVCSRRLWHHFYPLIVADGLNVDAGSFGQFANRYFRSFYFSWRNHVIRHGLPLAGELCSRGENVTRCPTGQENRNGDDTSAKGERGLIAQSQE
jgi:hypothetical protein